jgi:predicted transcriptional regulator
MSLSNLLADAIPVLTPNDSVAHALQIMEDNNYAQLPVVDQEMFWAEVSENDLLEIDNTEALLKDLEWPQQHAAIDIGQHPYEALKSMFDWNLSILPVIESGSKYTGSITKESLLKYLYENSLMQVPGGIIVLQIPAQHYSLCEIARICENEDIIVLDVHIKNTAGGDLEVTLKTNKTMLDGVVASFERYKYEVKEVFSETLNKEDLLDKYHLLMNYINM